jgi:hypothetical protein
MRRAGLKPGGTERTMRRRIAAAVLVGAALTGCAMDEGTRAEFRKWGAVMQQISDNIAKTAPMQPIQPIPHIGPTICTSVPVGATSMRPPTGIVTTCH